jgi:hypothetical protein
MKQSRTLIFFLVITFCFACRQDGHSTVGDTNNRWQIKPKLFGMNDISSLSDTLIIRVWYMHSFSAFIPIVTMEKTGGLWHGNLYSVFRAVENDSMVVRKIKSQTLNPASGWTHLMLKLQELEIYDLPDETEVPEIKSGCCDGSSYAFEIKNGATCRTYSYSNPQFDQNVLECQKVVSMLDLIEKELGVPRNTESTGWNDFAHRQMK